MEELGVVFIEVEMARVEVNITNWKELDNEELVSPRAYLM